MGLAIALLTALKTIAHCGNALKEILGPSQISIDYCAAEPLQPRLRAINANNAFGLLVMSSSE